MASILTLDGSASGEASSSITVSCTLTTAGTNDVVIVAVGNETNSSTNSYVTTIAGGSLTWALRKSFQWVNGAGKQSTIDVYWAQAVTALAAVTITATLSSTFDNAGIIAFGVNGSPSPSSPFDANASLPGTDTANAPISGLATDDTYDFVFAICGNGYDNRSTVTGQYIGSGVGVGENIANVQNTGGSNWWYMLAGYTSPGGLGSGIITWGSSPYSQGASSGVVFDALVGSSTNQRENALKLNAYGAEGNGGGGLTVPKMVAYAAISSQTVGTITGVGTLAGVGAAATGSAGIITGVGTLASVGASVSDAVGTLTGQATLSGATVALYPSVGILAGSSQLTGRVTTTPLIVTKLNAYGAEGSDDNLVVIKLDGYGAEGSDYQLLTQKLTSYGAESSTVTLVVHKIVAYGALSFFATSAGTIIADSSLEGVQLTPSPPCELPETPPLAAPLTKIIQAYVYQEYNDDVNIQAIFAAYNTLAQGYMDWFTQTPLGLYTSPNITGLLLDWLATGIYGIRRPVIGTITPGRRIGALGTVPLATHAVAVDKFFPGVNSAMPVSDDIYKRVLTWWLYRGDSKQMSIDWIARRVNRFLYGVNGTDVPYPSCMDGSIVSIGIGKKAGKIGAVATVVLGNLALAADRTKLAGLSSFTITVPAGYYATVLQELVAAGLLALPFQNNFTVVLI